LTPKTAEGGRKERTNKARERKRVFVLLTTKRENE